MVSVGQSAYVLDDAGQSTVEAAFLLPVLLGLVLLLLQPGILLYDRIVMQNAAAEACRFLSTSSSSSESCEMFVRRRLGAVPQHEVFHVHDGSCTWNIKMENTGSSGEASVTIENQARLLPLIGWAAGLMGFADASGVYTFSVAQSLSIYPDWVGSSPAGSDSSKWAGAWLS